MNSDGVFSSIGLFSVYGFAVIRPIAFVVAASAIAASCSGRPEGLPTSTEQVVSTTAATTTSETPSEVQPITVDNQGLNQDLTRFLESIDEVGAHFDRVKHENFRRLNSKEIRWDMANVPGTDTHHFLARWVASEPRSSWNLDWDFPSLNAMRNDLVKFDPVADNAEFLLDVRELFIDYLDARITELGLYDDALDAIKRDWENPEDGSKSYSHHINAVVDGASSAVDDRIRDFCDATLTLEQFFEVNTYNSAKTETVCAAMHLFIS